jgi:endonuclease/exonuclease/phosphatase family metal-dependent hydrolase
MRETKMAKTFSSAEWTKVHNYARRHAEQFGLPFRRRKSVVLGSFNIRKLGSISKKSSGAWKLLKLICERFDLLAIQEVQDNLEGIRHLKTLVGEDYGLVASDITGKHPGSSSMPERLAFLFKWKVAKRTEIASDISYDRTKVSNTLFENRTDFQNAFAKHNTKRRKIIALNAARKRAGKKPKTTPAVPNPHFLTFIRQPLCVSIEIGNRSTKNPYQFLAVNCHLLYGTDKAEREREFNALLDWIIRRAKNKKRMYYPNILLMGDCNLEFKKPKVDRPRISAVIKSINKKKIGGRKNAQVNFPFLDVHPSQTEVYRTAARLKDTYDQIAIVYRDQRLPDYTKNRSAGAIANGYDFGVFNFVDMFANALHGKNYQDLSKKARKALIDKFQHDVSDHLPLWIRLPMPD